MNGVILSRNMARMFIRKSDSGDGSNRHKPLRPATPKTSSAPSLTAIEGNIPEERYFEMYKGSGGFGILLKGSETTGEAKAVTNMMDSNQIPPPPQSESKETSPTTEVQTKTESMPAFKRGPQYS